MRHFSIILAIMLVCGCRTPAANPNASVPNRIDVFHHLIRDTAMSERQQAMGRHWEDVRARFDAEGYRVISTRDNQYTTDHTYLIRSAAWSSASGQPYDLIVHVTVDQRDPKELPAAKPNMVMDVAAGLLGRPNVTFDSLAGDDLYLSESAVGRCFATAESQKALKKYRIVKEVEVTYGLLRDKWWRTLPYGFCVRLELGMSAANNEGGMQLFFTVWSDLDPPEDWYGHALPENSGTRQMLDGVSFWGSDEWRQS